MQSFLSGCLDLEVNGTHITKKFLSWQTDNRQGFFPPNTSSLFFFLKLLYLTHAVSVGALKRYVQYCKEYFTNNELNTWIQLYKLEI